MVYLHICLTAEPTSENIYGLNIKGALINQLGEMWSPTLGNKDGQARERSKRAQCHLLISFMCSLEQDGCKHPILLFLSFSFLPVISSSTSYLEDIARMSAQDGKL